MPTRRIAWMKSGLVPQQHEHLVLTGGVAEGGVGVLEGPSTGHVHLALLELARADGPCEPVDELTAKDQGKRLLVEQVVVLGGNPAFRFGIKSTAGNEAVQMEMGLEQLIPGVQDGHKAELSPEMILPKLEQGPGDGVKEHLEHQGLVTQDEGVQLMGQSEDGVEVGNR